MWGLRVHGSGVLPAPAARGLEFDSRVATLALRAEGSESARGRRARLSPFRGAPPPEQSTLALTATAAPTPSRFAPGRTCG